MDDSLSSEIFEDAAGLLDNSFTAIKEKHSYDAMLSSTKETLSACKNEFGKSTFPSYFGAALESSWTCMIQGLEDVKELLSDTSSPINKIIGYLTDCVYLLQTLTNLYKDMIESVSVTCCEMRMLPKQTALIICSVFEHCRDSESLYRNHLRSVEKQLKDLFRICHELQLTYLLILEKHFIFDLEEADDKTVLVEVLKINLLIGQVVHSLDVKTMAEQWKAFTLICEKYSSSLGDTDVFIDCSYALCMLIKNNMDTAFEKDQDDKVITRSLKVASFTIKILLKTCITFKHSDKKDYCQIMDLLLYIWNNNVQRLEVSDSFSSGILNNVTTPSDSLLKELLMEDEFVCYFLDSASQCEETNENNLLGSVLAITSAMRCTAQTNRRQQGALKTKLVSCLYSLLPNCHTLLQRRLNLAAFKTHSLFDHMIVNTTALTLTMTSEEFNGLEKAMIEAILGTECVSALFSASLWTILAKQMNSHLHFNQLIWLCTMFKKLSKLKGFISSPQKIHLGHTISQLFKVMGDEDKLKISKQFRIHDEDNLSLWAELRIRNLPEESRRNAEEAIAEKLKSIFSRLRESESTDLLIDITNLAATCTFKTTGGIDDHVVQAWSNICQARQVIVRALDRNTSWFYDYVNALVRLTDTTLCRLREKSSNIIQILHVISGLVKQGDTEMRLILTKILCNLTADVNEHKNLVDLHLTEAFTSLLEDSGIVQRNLFNALKAHVNNEYVDNVITNVVSENSIWLKTWENLKHGIYAPNRFATGTCYYIHKCFETTSAKVQDSLKDSNLDDFYFDSGGSEMMVETDVQEPCSKRGKPNTHEWDSIIKILEENTALLDRHYAYTPEQLSRIQLVCEKLKNISQ